MNMPGSMPLNKEIAHEAEDRLLSDPDAEAGALQKNILIFGDDLFTGGEEIVEELPMESETLPIARDDAHSSSATSWF